MQHHDVFGFGHEPHEGSPCDLADRALERTSVTDRVGRHECHLVLAESGFGRDSHQCGLTSFIDRTVRRDDLHEDEQGLGGPQIHQDEVGKLRPGSIAMTDCLRQSVIACHDLVAALAQPDDAGLLEESRREFLHHRLGDHRAWAPHGLVEYEQEGEGTVVFVGAIGGSARGVST